MAARATQELSKLLVIEQAIKRSERLALYNFIHSFSYVYSATLFLSLSLSLSLSLAFSGKQIVISDQTKSPITFLWKVLEQFLSGSLSFKGRILRSIIVNGCRLSFRMDCFSRFPKFAKNGPHYFLNEMPCDGDPRFITSSGSGPGTAFHSFARYKHCIR